MLVRLLFVEDETKMWWNAAECVSVAACADTCVTGSGSGCRSDEPKSLFSYSLGAISVDCGGHIACICSLFIPFGRMLTFGTESVFVYMITHGTRRRNARYCRRRPSSEWIKALVCRQVVVVIVVVIVLCVLLRVRTAHPGDECACAFYQK